MTRLEIFTAARALLAQPNDWTTYTAARNHDDEPVDVASPEACKFCAQGAIQRAVWDDFLAEGREHDDELDDRRRFVVGFLISDCLDDLRRTIILDMPNNPNTGRPFDSIGGFNDAWGRTHADVLKAFDKMITRLKEKKS